MLRPPFAVPAIALVLTILSAAEATAAGQRTFVASTGNDGNPCTLQLPCRTFAPAIAATNAAGEVIVLDSAGYGSFTITKSISIIAPPGVYAGFSPTAGQDGVTIAAGGTDKVVLRGLTINGQGGDRGIVVTSGGEVDIEQCTVSNMNQSGIEITGGGAIHIRSSVVHNSGVSGLRSSGGPQHVEVLDSEFTANGDSGILVESGTLDAQRISVENNLRGILILDPPASTTVTVTLTDSVISGNASSGIWVQAFNFGSLATVAMIRSTSARNSVDGISVFASSGSSIVTVSDSALIENGADGLYTTGAGTFAIVNRSTLAGNGEHELHQTNSAFVLTTGNNTKVGANTGTVTPVPEF